MDYTKMDGYQFEDYIESILKNLGLIVRNVGYSNDGGIDLIAVCNEPIYKGTYIIQCKNWEEKVGQPAIRDLYGVIMDSRANKGILITTSDFTEQAYEFAEGKNIELINRTGLLKLEELSSSKRTVEDNVKDSFLTCEAFDKDKYNYIIDKINSDPGVDTYYDYALDFLGEYIFSMDYLGSMEGIIEEYIRICDEMMKKVYNRKRKSDICEKNKVLLRKSFAYIMTGAVDKAVEILFDIGREWFTPGLYDQYKRNISLKELIPMGHGLEVSIDSEQSYDIFKIYHHLFICMGFEDVDIKFIERFFGLNETCDGNNHYGNGTFRRISFEELKELHNSDHRRVYIPKKIAVNSSKGKHNIYGYGGGYIVKTEEIIESWNQEINLIKKNVMKIIDYHSEI